jgi:hypothetical protein
MLNKSLFLLLVLSLLLPPVAEAGSFRCGTKLVKTGDTIGRLVKACGKPVMKYKSKESIRSSGSRKSASVTNWVYERGRKRNMVVSILSGRVVKIGTD